MGEQDLTYTDAVDCAEHGWHGEDCPFCRISELKAKLAAVEQLPDEWESAEDSTGLSGEIALSGYTCADMLRDALKATP